MQVYASVKYAKVQKYASIPAQSQCKYASMSVENLHGRCPNEKHFPTLQILS